MILLGISDDCGVYFHSCSLPALRARYCFTHWIYKMILVATYNKYETFILQLFSINNECNVNQDPQSIQLNAIVTFCWITVTLLWWDALEVSHRPCMFFWWQPANAGQQPLAGVGGNGIGGVGPRRHGMARSTCPSWLVVCSKQQWLYIWGRGVSHFVSTTGSFRG